MDSLVVHHVYINSKSSELYRNSFGNKPSWSRGKKSLSTNSHPSFLFFCPCDGKHSTRKKLILPLTNPACRIIFKSKLSNYSILPVFKNFTEDCYKRKDGAVWCPKQAHLYQNCILYQNWLLYEVQKQSCLQLWWLQVCVPLQGNKTKDIFYWYK